MNERMSLTSQNRESLPGNLGCYWESDEEWLFPAIEFLRDGFESQGKMLCLAGLFSCQKILGSLRLKGIESGATILRGDLKLISSRDFLIRDEELNFDLLEAFVIDQCESSDQKGFSNLRFVIDAAWLKGPGEGSRSALRRFIQRLGTFQSSGKIFFLILYHLAHCPSDVLLLGLETHAHVFFGGLLGENFFHTPGHLDQESSAPALFRYRAGFLQKAFSRASTAKPIFQPTEESIPPLAPPPVVVPAPFSERKGALSPREAMESLEKAAYLHALEIIFGANLSLQKIFGLLLREAKTLSRSTLGFVATFDRQSGKLLVKARDAAFQDECQILNEPGRRLVFLKPDSLLETLCRHVTHSGKGFFTNNLLEHPLVKGLLSPYCPLKQILIAPIVSTGEKVGLLVLGDPESDYLEADQEVVKGFSRTFGLVLHRYQLIENIDLLEQAISQIVEAVVTTGLDGAIISWNPVFEQIFECTEGKPPHANIFQILFPTEKEEIPVFVFEGLQKSNFWSGRTKCATKNGSPLELEISVSTVVQETEEVTVLVWALRTVTTTRTAGSLSNVLGEFQRILALVLGNVEMLHISFGSIDSDHQSIQNIRIAVDRAQSLINSLRSIPD